MKVIKNSLIILISLFAISYALWLGILYLKTHTQTLIESGDYIVAYTKEECQGKLENPESGQMETAYLYTVRLDTKAKVSIPLPKVKIITTKNLTMEEMEEQLIQRICEKYNISVGTDSDY